MPMMLRWSSMSKKTQAQYKTGVSVLDETLPGGIPEGGIVLLNTDPESKGERFLHYLIDGQSCGYITTSGSGEGVKSELMKSGVDHTGVDARSVGYTNPANEIQKSLGELAEKDIIVIDSINPLEDNNITDPEVYRQMLTEIQKHTRRMGGYVILRRLRPPDVDSQDGLYLADTLVDYILSITQRINGSEVEDYLHIPKARATANGEYFDKEYKLVITDEVVIDTSRDIA